MSIATSTGMKAALPATMSQRQTGRLLLGLGLATAMQFFMVDSVNLVLPDMAWALGLSRDEGSWILTVYSSTLFFGVPLSTYLARRLGVLRFLIGSVVVFGIASVGCAAAHGLETMLVISISLFARLPPTWLKTRTCRSVSGSATAEVQSELTMHGRIESIAPANPVGCWPQSTSAWAIIID